MSRRPEDVAGELRAMATRGEFVIGGRAFTRRPMTAGEADAVSRIAGVRGGGGDRPLPGSAAFDDYLGTEEGVEAALCVMYGVSPADARACIAETMEVLRGLLASL